MERKSLRSPTAFFPPVLSLDLLASTKSQAIQKTPCGEARPPFPQPPQATSHQTSRCAEQHSQTMSTGSTRATRTLKARLGNATTDRSSSAARNARAATRTAATRVRNCRTSRLGVGGWGEGCGDRRRETNRENALPKGEHAADLTTERQRVEGATRAIDRSTRGGSNRFRRDTPFDNTRPETKQAEHPL